MAARIYKPAKDAMSSGLARTKLWGLEFDASKAPEIEPLMGWTTNGDPMRQVRLSFDTREEAVAYAEREGIPYRVEEPHEAKRKTVAYSDNFKFNRAGPWTH
jgi:hypothetical protein